VTADQREALQALIDRAEVRSVLERYARGIDRVWPELISDCYHDESWDEHGAFEGTGGAFALQSDAATARTRPSNVSSHHLLGQSTIELMGDSAVSETYFLSTGVRQVESGTRRTYQIAGRYVDRLDRVDGRWRIRFRRTLVDSSAEAEVDGWPPAEHFIRGARWPDDAVFRPDLLNLADLDHQR
jgi:hypothetical protein